MALLARGGASMLDMGRICTDLQAEQEDLDHLLTGLSEADWDRQTPAVGWSIRDQVSHLGTTDRVATMAAGEPARFTAEILHQDRAERTARQRETGRSMP